jgi:FkbM family methyltransferase
MPTSDSCAPVDAFTRRRIEMTTACRDCDSLPKHPDAGRVIEWRGHNAQVMHEGTKVRAGGYYGGWMQEIIARLGGHHEPQEELIFHSLLRQIRTGGLMVEVGSFWAYYTNWFLGAVPGGRAICVEPDFNYLAIGRANVALNDRHAEFHLACVGREAADAVVFRQESDGGQVYIPRLDWSKLVEIAGGAGIDLLHVDIQGAELPLLESLPERGAGERLRFVAVSTHHAAISGSTTTHRDCLLRLIRCGASILCEHSVEESFSGDGLIVASFWPADAEISMPEFHRNEPANSLFGLAPSPLPAGPTPAVGSSQTNHLRDRAEQAVLCQARCGQMWVMPSDLVIGASLLSRGSFEEQKIDEVVSFLIHRYAFEPRQFIDVGANVGTHLVHALTSGRFREGVAFEADPLNHELLSRNASRNGLDGRSRILHVPLSDRVGLVTLELALDNLGDHRIQVGVRKRAHAPEGDLYAEGLRHTVSLVAETLDNLDVELQLGIAASTLAWIDTQGHEGHVLRGARGLISAGRLRFVVIECWPYGLERSGGRERFFEFLARSAAIHDLSRPGWQLAAGLGVDEVRDLYDAMLTPACDHTDLLCVVR